MTAHQTNDPTPETAGAPMPAAALALGVIDALGEVHREAEVSWALQLDSRDGVAALTETLEGVEGTAVLLRLEREVGGLPFRLNLRRYLAIPAGWTVTGLEAGPR